MAFVLNLKAIGKTQINTAQDRGLLPEGTFAAKINKCEVTTSNAGYPYFNFEFAIEAQAQYAACPFAGRRLWNTLMISHPRETVMEIAHKTMADILVACGSHIDTKMGDLERNFPLAVIDKPIYIRVYHKMDKLKQELRPDIDAYFGRGEYEGIHRYDDTVIAPVSTETLTSNEALCKKAIIARDAKLVKQDAAAKAKATGYSHNPLTDMQKAKTEVAFSRFEDVPF